MAIKTCMGWPPNLYIKASLYVFLYLFHNSIGNETNSFFNDNSTYTNIRFDGFQQTYFPLIAHSQCHVDITTFPFDEQTCHVDFSTWTNDETRVKMYTELDFITAQYQNSSSWILLHGTVQNISTLYYCCPYPFSSVRMTLHMKRISEFYSIVLLFPITISWVPILLGYVTPTASGERISISMSVLLTLAFFIEVANQSLPQSSNHIPMFGLYYIGVISVIVMSMLISAIATKLSHSREYELDKDLNRVRRSLLRFGSKIPYIGSKCFRLLELKDRFVLGKARDGEKKIEKSTRKSVPGQVLDVISKVLSHDEGFEEGNENSNREGEGGGRLEQKQDLRRRTTTTDDYTNNSQQSPHLHVTEYSKKMHAFKQISTHLKRMCMIIQKRNTDEIQEDDQTCYANAIVELIDRMSLLASTIFLVIWFAIIVVPPVISPNTDLL